MSYKEAKAKLARRTGENQNSPYSGDHDDDVPGLKTLFYNIQPHVLAVLRASSGMRQYGEAGDTGTHRN